MIKNDVPIRFHSISVNGPTILAVCWRSVGLTVIKHHWPMATEALAGGSWRQRARPTWRARRQASRSGRRHRRSVRGTVCFWKFLKKLMFGNWPAGGSAAEHGNFSTGSQAHMLGVQYCSLQVDMGCARRLSRRLSSSGYVTVNNLALTLLYGCV